MIRRIAAGGGRHRRRIAAVVTIVATVLSALAFGIANTPSASAYEVPRECRVWPQPQKPKCNVREVRIEGNNRYQGSSVVFYVSSGGSGFTRVRPSNNSVHTRIGTTWQGVQLTIDAQPESGHPRPRLRKTITVPATATFCRAKFYTRGYAPFTLDSFALYLFCT